MRGTRLLLGALVLSAAALVTTGATPAAHAGHGIAAVASQGHMAPDEIVVTKDND